MTDKFSSTIKAFIIKPWKLFLVDSFGALVTGFLTGTLLVKHVDFFGMPVKPLNVLSIIAFTFAIYSICCYFFLDKNWRPYLKFIAFANLLYCCLTITIVTYFYSSITTPGLIYFSAELIVIVCLARIEFMTATFRLANPRS